MIAISELCRRREKLIEEPRDLRRVAPALHKRLARGPPRPWTLDRLLLGIVVAAYDELETRTSLIAGRGSKRALITSFIEASLSEEFAVSQVREAAPGVSAAYISRVLGELRAAGAIERIGRGRGSRWRRVHQRIE